MGTDKRDRQKANKQAKLEAERAAEAKAKRNRSIRNFAILAVAIVIAMVLISLTSCSSDSDGEKVNTDAFADQGASTDDDQAANPPEGSPAEYGTGECPPEEGVDQPVIDLEDAFARCIDLDRTYVATIETSEG